ncbi:hypothetical protein [Streptomyces althioticus]|uniref:hypothetical protein n=1 Tax=Streptomyces althioticus TaxID=83380 RepID=UPI0036C327CE
MSGTPLTPGDSTFALAAVTAMAFGAARRTAEAITVLGGPYVTAGWTALLRDERLALVAELYFTPQEQGGRGRANTGEALDGRLGRAGLLAQQAMVGAYGHTLDLPGSEGGPAVARTVEDCVPILQFLRFASEILPPEATTGRGEGCAR